MAHNRNTRLGADYQSIQSSSKCFRLSKEQVPQNIHESPNTEPRSIQATTTEQHSTVPSRRTEPDKRRQTASMYHFLVPLLNCNPRLCPQFRRSLSEKWETRKAEVTFRRVIEERKASSLDTGLRDRLIRLDTAIHLGSHRGRTPNRLPPKILL